MKTVTLHMNHKHGDTQYYAGQTIELPDDDADWLAQAVVQTRIELRAKAEKLPGTIENMKRDAVKADD